MFRRDRTGYRVSGIGYSPKFIALGFGLWALCSVLPAKASAEEPPSKEPIVVNGDTVEYLHEKKEVTGSGNVSITYKDVLLTCDKITVHLDTKDAIAEGNVKITQKESYFTGEKILYNFDKRTGDIVNGYINSKPFYGKADEIAKVSEKEIKLDRGYVTTCELEKPHYRVQARQVKIYLEDRVVAKHILFFVGNVPIMYFPYYVQPLKEQTAHATIQVGKESEWGYYVLTSYRYYFSEICNGKFLVDYRTKKGLAEGVDNKYRINGLGDGVVRFYYTNENDSTAYDREGDTQSKYRVQVRHKWDMGNDTVATLELNKVRDQNFVKDYLYKEYEEAGDPDNYLSFITTKDNYTISLLFRKRMDKYFDVVERLPEFKIEIPNNRLTEKFPIYYKQETAGVYLNHTFPETDLEDQKDVSTIRFDTYHRLSYASKLLGSLSVTPYAAIRETYYSKNRWGTTNVDRTVFSAGLDNSIKFYRIYDVQTSYLGLDINKLRHIITPTANYYFTYQPTVSPDNLNQFDEVDSIAANNGIQFAIENKLQTKRPEGKDGPLKSVDLATLIVSTDYAFRLEKGSASFKSQKFQSIEFQLELSPYPWLYSIVKMSVDTKRQLIQSESVDLVARWADRWSLGLGHRFEDVESGRSNFATLDFIYKINEKWKVRAYERFNMLDGSFEEQEYTVYRDLHCWVAELTYNTKTYSDDQTIWFVMRLKAFPEYPIGFKRTYYRPQFGSTGNM